MFQAKSMRSSHIRMKKFSDAIARKLGKFHHLSVPINKDAGWLFKTMAKYVHFWIMKPPALVVE